jgi:dipeptidyl aminopeptidase/acylaminoacyl peptidase
LTKPINDWVRTTHQQEDMRMTRSLNQTGRRAVFAAIAACAAIAGTLGLASRAQAAMVFASTKQATVDGTTDFEIWKAENDGTTPVQITNNNAWDERPSLSTDGTKVVFASKRDGNWEIYRMNIDGSNQTRLTTSTNADTRPVWNNDGTKIAWQRTAGSNNDIWVMDQDGSNKTQITTHAAQDIAPAWNATGIAFSSNRSASGSGIGTNHDIWRIAANGTNPVRLTTSTDEEFDPSWYDTGFVLYTRNRPVSGGGVQRDLYEVDASGSNIGDIDQITNTPTRDECDAVRRPSSGGPLVFTNLSVGMADIWTINHSGTSTPGPLHSTLSTPTTNDQQVAFNGQ